MCGRGLLCPAIDMKIVGNNNELNMVIDQCTKLTSRKAFSKGVWGPALFCPPRTLQAPMNKQTCKQAAFSLCIYNLKNLRKK